jgi:transposase
MLADGLDYVIGVDSHRDRHALALVLVASGAQVLAGEVAADAHGYREALTLARAQAAGRRAWAIEGSGCYGKGLTRFLLVHGERVLEVERPKREGRRGRLKSDALDALRAARLVLGEQSLASPRRGGAREALRCLLVTRESAIDARRVALNQLRALIVTCPEPLRSELRRLTRARLVCRCRSFRAQQGEPERAGTMLALRLLARRIETLTHEERTLKRTILALVSACAPTLLAKTGVGPISAAQLLVSWSHRGRLQSESAFARLGGVAPIPASSGQLTRYRLDRGGDRKLNRALHQIVLSRRRYDANTAAYIQRRLQEGKSERDAVRCLKRYLARHLFRELERTAMTT